MRNNEYIKACNELAEEYRVKSANLQKAIENVEKAFSDENLKKLKDLVESYKN